MSEKKEYIVLARKYRPQKFSDLVGQEMLVEIITNAAGKSFILFVFIK